MHNERKIIDGALFEKMILGGAANLRKNLQKVNDLNVFPIPDGDTGENMYLTMQGGLEQLAKGDGTLGGKAQAVAQGMLLGARGNSGVILSQLFYGLSEGLKGLETADLKQFSNALKEGVKCAYGAVAHPVEGTILTVAREAAEKASENIDEDVILEDFFASYLKEMTVSLEKTPELLPVLKEAGVIDSGGAGLVYIVEGFCKAISGTELDGELAIASGEKKAIDLSKFNENSVMEFGYCTELLLQLQCSKTDVQAFTVQPLIDYLSTIGDSIVAFKTGTIIKLHVHTMTPWMVLQYCQQFGEFLTVKIENMTLQHNEAAEEKEEVDIVKMPKRARRKFATVTVASGEGLSATFKEMGADAVIFGGQTNNPSAEDFVAAFDEVNADYIFVLPNNSNIILAAKQAAKMYGESEIRVIESKSVGDGYSALSMLDYSSDDADEIEENLRESMQGTVTGMVSISVRDTSMNGVDVYKDHYMGFTNGKMLTCRPTKIEAVCALADALELGEKEFVIAVYGKGATEKERTAFAAYLSDKYANVELYEIEGGQEVYDFILIVE